MYELDIFIVGLVVIAIFVVVSFIFFSDSDSIVNLISIIIYILRQFYFHRYNLFNSIRIFHLYLAHRDLIVLEFVVDFFSPFPQLLANKPLLNEMKIFIIVAQVRSLIFNDE